MAVVEENTSAASASVSVPTSEMMVVPTAPNHKVSAASAVNSSDGTDEGVDRADQRQRDMMDLEELLSKLNPMAEEFVPPSRNGNAFGMGMMMNGGVLGGMMMVDYRGGSVVLGGENGGIGVGVGVGMEFEGGNGFYPNGFMMANGGMVNGNGVVGGNGVMIRRKKNYSQGKRRMNSRTSLAQREDVIRRTVYVSDIDQQITEEQLAGLFLSCGHVVDCRICGDTNSALRFAFIEFTDEDGASTALNLAGTMLGYYPVRVLPSKTAIAPVNPTFLPRSEDEREMCARTIYCTNIDKKVTQAEIKLFFETICGEVYRLRLLGDYHHSTRIAFVEFVMAESAIAALSCSGSVVGSLPIRVSPSKTPVRPRANPRPIMH